MSKHQAFQHSPGGAVPIAALTPEQRRQLDEQRAGMFTPGGELRRVEEIREAMKRPRAQEPDGGR